VNLDSTRLGTLPTATGRIARLAWVHARRAGIESTGLLQKAGVTGQQLDDRGARLTVQQQIKFLNLLAKSSGDRLLGFHLALRADLRELGLLYYVAASSPTLGEALRRVARYSSIVNEGLSVACLEGHDVRMVLEYVGVERHSDRHQLEFLMAALMRLCRQLTGLGLGACCVLWRQHNFWGKGGRAHFRRGGQNAQSSQC
jgi:Arabinose-binding domain of AraC transcription regulator, N-term